MSTEPVVIFERFVVKRDTRANFEAANTLLLSGEWGLETDTRKRKLGDGVTPWLDLPYDDDARGVTVAAVGGVVTLDADLAAFFKLTLEANATLEIINAPPFGALILRVDPAGFILTMPASVTAIGPAYVTSAGPEVLGFMTMDGGASFDVVFKQP